MRLPLILASVGTLFGWRLARKGSRAGRCERGLGMAGLATLILGASFVGGAVRENEPQAAAAATRLFGVLGGGLLLLSAIAGRRRGRTASK